MSDLLWAVYERACVAEGTPDEGAAFERLRVVTEHHRRVLCVNVPPPGWTPEEDRREELLAESEHLALRSIR